MMHKAPKKFVNGVLNYSVHNSTKNDISSRFTSNNYDIKASIDQKKSEKIINDSRLSKKEDNNDKKRIDEVDTKLEKAKDLLGIKKTSDKKSDKFNNSNSEYKERHKINSHYNNYENNMTEEGISIDDVFEDL